MDKSKAQQNLHRITDIMAEMALLAIDNPWDLTEHQQKKFADARPQMPHARLLLSLLGSKIAIRLSAKNNG